MLYPGPQASIMAETAIQHIQREATAMFARSALMGIPEPPFDE